MTRTADFREDNRKIAYHFAVQLEREHRFNNDMKIASFVWLHEFLIRRPDLSIREAEGSSIVHGQGMNCDEISNCLKLISIVENNDLLNKHPGYF